MIIGALVGVIALCYLIEIFIAPVDWGAAAFHTLVPQLQDAAAVTIAVGIIGATIMPHAIYLHSGLTQARMPIRSDADRKKLLSYSNTEVNRRADNGRRRQHGDGNDGLGRLPPRP